MQKLCCVRTRQHSLPVWIILSQIHHRISTKSQLFLVGIVSGNITLIPREATQEKEKEILNPQKEKLKINEKKLKI